MPLYVFEVGVDWAKEWTKRPRHLEAAIYHQQQADRRGTKAPRGCRLTIIPAKGNQPMMLNAISVLKIKDEWDKGHIPPLTPREEAAMHGQPLPIRKPRRRRARKPTWAEKFFTVITSCKPIHRPAPLLPPGVLAPS